MAQWLYENVYQALTWAVLARFLADRFPVIDWLPQYTVAKLAPHRTTLLLSRNLSCSSATLGAKLLQLLIHELKWLLHLSTSSAIWQSDVTCL
jgi:hypothetical protein